MPVASSWPEEPEADVWRKRSWTKVGVSVSAAGSAAPSSPGARTKVGVPSTTFHVPK